jgi:hypothetical protein
MKKVLISKKSLAFGAALVFMLSLGASSVSALSFELTSDHCTGGCLTGQTSGGTVTVTDNLNGSLTFNVLLANNNEYVNTGFDASFGFNLTGIGAVTYSGLSSGFSIVGVTNPQVSGNLHMDGTGFFDFGVLWGGGSGGGNADPNPLLVFTVAAAGLDITDLAANALGQYFGVDIISGTTSKTGGIDASTPTTSVPDGASTITLLGSVLLGIGILRRRISKT